VVDPKISVREEGNETKKRRRMIKDVLLKRDDCE
jgi:hypothetical protein